jgi:hypothetical protein
MTISKSDYLLHLKHPAWLWLKKYTPDRLPPIDDNLQAILATGHAFEQYAEALFDSGVTLGFDDYASYRDLPQRTRDAIERGEKTIFQGRFEHEGLTFIGDIIDVVDEGMVDLYEIKSSTSAKPVYIDDLAFQLVVLEGCGYQVRNIAVIHVNAAYVRDGDIDPQHLTATTDVTEAVKASRDVTRQRAHEALESLARGPDAEPDYGPDLADPNSFGEWLEVYRYLFPPEEGSVYQLCQLKPELLARLEQDGIMKISDIPPDYQLKPKQTQQVEAARRGEPIIDRERIAAFIDELRYPLYFLDYETMSSLVPYFDGLRPYQQVPFQYSLHMLDAPDAELRHVEYLHRDYSNPAPAVAAALREHLGPDGSIVTWNMSFEKSCNDTMASLSPDHAEFLAEVNERIVDLMVPFSRGWYVDAGFHGSASIKSVLPVLAPHLSYKSLVVQEGGAAQRIWMETILEGKHEHDCAQILKDLSAYCTLDTLAMVEIYKYLKRELLDK